MEQAKLGLPPRPRVPTLALRVCLSVHLRPQVRAVKDET